ncbi:unnamed protein product [Ectocarpus sp. 4 AP-2014]
MKLMPPKANSLTTEHIKSRLQKYRLHAHRSKEEFLEFYGLRLEGKFADFLRKEGWRSLSPAHGREGQHDGPEYDSAGGGDGREGGGEGRRAAAAATGSGSSGEPSPAAAVKIDGKMVGDIRDLGAQCVREQFHLQEVLRQHISAQLKLQAEIHEHLTTAAVGSTAAAAAPSPLDGSNSEGFNEEQAVEGKGGQEAAR